MKYIFLLAVSSCFACTDFMLKDTKGGVVVGRTLEFGQQIESQIRVYSRAQDHTSMVDGKKGLEWRNRYGFVAITAFDSNNVVDGMNEVGLSYQVLWFPGAKYPPLKKQDLSKTIDVDDLGLWLLGTFKSCKEIKEHFHDIEIWAHVIPQLHMVPPFHLSFHDADGQSLVIEFINGKTMIHDNLVGVCTNMPDFPWQMANLSKYVNLSPIQKNPKTIDGMTVKPTGEGSGLIGLPGDPTPPSRFVKIALLSHFAKPANDYIENINLATHLINTVDIPYGITRPSDGSTPDYTQWAVVKDLHNLTMHYRTYKDLTMKELSLKSALGEKDFKPIPMKGSDL